MDDTTLRVDVERRFRRGPTIGAAFELGLGRPETLVLFGPSGSGKTTILRCLAGLERPDRGRIAAGPAVWFDAVAGLDLAPQRRRVGYLPQGLALFPHLDVRGNVAFGLSAGSRLERRARVTELLERFGLGDLGGRHPSQLSGGQQQRVALARALAGRPRLLLLDEPLSALDAPTRETLRGELRRQLQLGGVPAVVVTHDRAETLVLGDRVAVVIDGAIRQVGPTLEVFDKPADETVARIVGVETVVPAVVREATDGLVRLAVGEAELVAIGDWAAGSAVLVSIRAEDVILELAPETAGVAPGLSARNQLRGQVTQIEPAGPLVRVEIDCGFRLVAAVTRPALEDLGLRPGVWVAALLKAPAVHVIG